MGVVPSKMGNCLLRQCLTKKNSKIQEDLPKYMNEHGFELERGELNSEAKHKTVAEFKQEMAGKEIEKQLVLEYGAPEYVNHQEEFVTKEEYQEAYEVFQNELELGLISLIFLGEKRLFKKNRLGQKSSGGRTTTISKL